MATVLPGWICAVLITAPTPVTTAQPNSAATSSGRRRIDHHDRAAIDDGVFGVAGNARLMVHRLAVEMQPMVARQELARRRAA